MVAIVSETELDATSGPVIVRAPGTVLAQMVGVMASAERIVGVIAAGTPHQPGEDVMACMLAPDALIQTRSIISYDDKLHCMAAVGELLDTVNTSRDRKETIQQCIDELVMNALYDAPVDARGRRLFADMAVKDRIRMRTDRTVRVRFASDGTTFAIAVRDSFGSLDRATVLRFLDKALHSSTAVDQRASGGGVGLYLIATSATALAFTVAPGLATEVVCTFELDRAARLEQLSFFALTATTRPLPEARRIVVRRRHPWLFRGSVALSAGILGGIALVAGHRFLGAGRPVKIAITTEPGSAVELDGRPVGTASDGTFVLAGLRAGLAHRLVIHRDGFESAHQIVQARPGSSELAMPLRAVATVDLETAPADATVTITGKPMGVTPVALTALVPGATLDVAFAHPGYRTTTAKLVVPAAGQHSRLAQKLDPSGDVVRVRLSSTPPGAAIVRAGALLGADRTYTPADLDVAKGQTQSFTLVMPGYKPFVIEPFVASSEVEKSAVLVAQ